MRKLGIDFDRTTLARMANIVLFVVIVAEHGQNRKPSLWLFVAMVVVLGTRMVVRRFRRRTLKRRASGLVSTE